MTKISAVLVGPKYSTRGALGGHVDVIGSEGAIVGRVVSVGLALLATMANGTPVSPNGYPGSFQNFSDAFAAIVEKAEKQGAQ